MICNERQRHRRWVILLGIALAALGWATSGYAQTLFWDLNGSTAGAGTTPSANWILGGSNWNTNSTGAGATTGWVNDRDAVFSAGSDATGSYTVNLSSTSTFSQIKVSSITVQDGTVRFTGSSITFNDATPDFTVAAGLTATSSNALLGSNGLNKLGDGILIFDSVTKGYSGTTSVGDGTLQINSNEMINNASTVAISAGATFGLNWGITETIGGLSGAGTVDLRTGTLNVASTGNTTFSGVIHDSYGTLNKSGSGSLTLSGANTYTGITNINAGALVAAHSSALGGATHGNTIASGGALHLQGGINLTEGQFSVTGTGVGNTGAIRNLSGSNTLNASIDLTGNTLVTSAAGSLNLTGQTNLGGNTLTASGAGNITLSGVVTNSGGIAYNGGGGTLTLAGTGANSYTGALTINDGTVALAKSSGTNAVANGAVVIGNGSGAAGSAVLRLDASHQIADYSGLITINSDGELRMNNFAESVNSLTSTGRINLGSSGALTVGVNSGNSSIGGSILGTGTLIKEGSGTLALLSDIVLAGELQLKAGTLALGGFDLTAGTLRVTGNSTIDFAGGNSILSLTNLVVDAGVVLTVQNWANAADYFYTQGWTGAVFDSSGSAPMNQVVFQGYSASNTHWQSFDKQVTPIPEPSTYGALLLGSLGAVVAFRRYRRSRR